MKFRNFIILLLIVVLACFMIGCRDENGINNSSTVQEVNPEGDDGNDSPKKLTWSTSSNSTVRIVDFGLHPKTETVSFNFGYDTIGMKKNGYTILNFALSFTAYVDTGIKVETTVDAYFQDKDKNEIGVGWSGLKFTNTNSVTYNYSKSTSIENIQQNQGKLYLKFTAVKNTFQTGTYISSINLTVTAE